VASYNIPLIVPQQEAPQDRKFPITGIHRPGWLPTTGNGGARNFQSLENQIAQVSSDWKYRAKSDEALFKKGTIK
jgi:hypothetical protein